MKCNLNKTLIHDLILFPKKCDQIKNLSKNNHTGKIKITVISQTQER